MEMQQIRYFLALSRTLNFTRAAEECHVSQSALTRAIQALEGELGGELIRREHSSSHLTELGKRMLPLMERCFESAVTAKAVAQSLSSDALAPLSVLASHSVNVEALMPAIAELFRSMNCLQLKILHANGGDVVEKLKAGEADLAVAGPLEANWDRLDRWALFDEPFELAVREDHPLALENEIMLDKLKAYPLFCQGGCEMHDTAVRMLEARGISPSALHEVTTQHDLIAVIGNGIGAAILPRSAPRGERIRRLPISDLQLSRTVYAYAVAGRRRETAAAAFLNLLRSTDFAG